MEIEDAKNSSVRRGSRAQRKEKNQMVDLTTSSRHFFNAVGFSDKLRRGNRVVRRGKERQLALPVEGDDSIHIEQAQLTYITGMKYYFQNFIRRFSVATLIVWIFLFLAEGAMVLMYVYQSTLEGVGMSWNNYDRTEWSFFFWSRVTLSVVLLSQLLFAYSVSLSTIIIVILTTVYQLVIFVVALITDDGQLTKTYIPFFLRCWPMRQYFLFVLDSIAIMTPRSGKFDLIRLAVGPLTLFICLVFTTACFFRIDQTFRGYPINIGVSLYFVIVTVSTVGFGDIVPQTPEGKGIVIIAVFVFLARMPLFIQVIRSTVSIYKSYKSYRGESGHFLVYGHLTAVEVISILDEALLFYPSKTFLFCNSKFPDDVLALSHNPAYQSRSTFLTIDSLSLASLQRLKATSCGGFMMFPLSTDRYSRVDDDVLLASRIMKRRAPAVPQFLWFRYGLHANLLKKNFLIIEAHLKRSILSTALLLPGIIPFLVNLIRTSWTGGEYPEELWEKKGIWDWKNQYRYSRHQTIGGFFCPTYFVGKTFQQVLKEHKMENLLVVGVQRQNKSFHRAFLSLQYIVCKGDKLILIYDPTRHRELLNNPLALNTFWELRCPLGEFEVDTRMASETDRDVRDNHGVAAKDSISGAYLHDLIFSKRKAVDREAKSNILRKSVHTKGSNERASFRKNDAQAFDALRDSSERDEEDLSNDGEGSETTNLSAERLIECLCSLQFTLKKPLGIPLDKVKLNAHAVQSLNDLLRRHSDAIADPYCPRLDRQRLENMINNLLEQIVYESRNLEGEEGSMASKDIVLFVDLPPSVLGSPNTSVYEEIIAHTLARYQLFTMMRNITSIHNRTTAVLLTMRKHPKVFLENWANVFASPLRYVRGQTTLAVHLTYALTIASNLAHVRGILLYSSSLRPNHHGDIPVYTVDKRLREIIDAYEKAHSNPGEPSERNIVVEVGCFTSCVQLSPFHTDLEWIVRGKENFQDTLSFMSGRCLSSNMMITLPFYAHYDSSILDFFTMVFQHPLTEEVFNESQWENPPFQPQILFCYHRDRHGSFSTFGGAFDYLYMEHSYIAFGIFRLFPQKAGLPQKLRYFVTNPPRRAPLVPDDIIYCLNSCDS